MKIKINKKNRILLFVIFVVIALLISVIVGISQMGKKYPEQPVSIQNIGVAKTALDITNSKAEIEYKDITLYSIAPKIHISLVESMIEKMDLSLKKEERVKDSYIIWGDGNNQFTYQSATDTVAFELTTDLGISKSDESFSQFFKQYFDLDYEFIVTEESTFDGTTTIYASRVIDGIPIEFGNGSEYTDILKFNKEGNLISGYLLLAQLEETELTIPLIKEGELETYINLETYPKEITVDTSVLTSTIDLHYLDRGWLDINESAKECKATSYTTVLLYKNSNQEYLLPAYKYNSNCKVEYEKAEYTVPATFYVSASDPKYVTVE
jgi:hypothetical protein